MSEGHDEQAIHPSEEELAGHAIDTQDGLTPDPRVAEHLEGCARCSRVHDELRLLAAGRLPGDGRALSEALDEDLQVDWEYPPDGVWSSIAADLGRSEGVAVSPSAPEPAGEPGGHRPVGAIRNSLPWLAAAAALVLGLAVGRALGTGDEGEVTRVAQLSTVGDERQGRGDAELVRSDDGLALRVAPSDLPRGEGYLEVWLLNTDGTRMVSVGVLDGESTRDYQVTQDLIDQGYTIVDISREPYDDKPEHSGDSLARGALET